MIDDTMRRWALDHIEDIAREELGNENDKLSNKRRLRWGNRGSFVLEIDGAKRGIWHDTENSIGGDPIKLIAYLKRLSIPEVEEYIREQSGDYRPDPEAERVQRERARREAEREKAEKQAKVRAILKETGSLAGTAGRHYWRQTRNIADVPDCLGWRPRAFGEYGALVAVATNRDGIVTGGQEIYVDDRGRKAPLSVQKRSFGTIKGSAAVMARREKAFLPADWEAMGEGTETVGPVWCAIGTRTLACLGLNFADAPVTPGAKILLIRDGDRLDAPIHDNVAKQVAKLRARGHIVVEVFPDRHYLFKADATPNKKTDFNDIAIRELDVDAIIRATVAASIKAALPSEFEFCEPSFTAPATTAQEAQDELRQAFNRAWDDKIIPGVWRWRTWAAEAAIAKENGATPLDRPLMPQIGMKPSMSVGKTQVIIENATSTPGIRMALFEPCHVVGSDVERRIKGLDAEGAAAWQGIERPDPKAPGCTMCRRLQAVLDTIASGGKVEDVCGNRKRGYCQHHPESGCAEDQICGKKRQDMEMAETQASVIVLPHAMMTNAAPNALRRKAISVPFMKGWVEAEQPVCDITGIDEGPWQGMLQVRKARLPFTELMRNYIDDWAVPAQAHEDPLEPSRRLRELSIEAHDMLSESFDKKSRVRVSKAMFRSRPEPLTAETCLEAHGLTWRLHTDPSKVITPDMPDDEISRILKPIAGRNAAVRRMARFWKTIAEFLESDEKVSPYMTLTAIDDEEEDAEEADEEAPEKKEKKPPGEPVIALSWRDEIHPDWLQGPLVYADGTMDEGLTKFWLPRIDVISRAQASTPDAVYRRQVLDRPVSHMMVCPKKKGKLDKYEKTRRNHATKLAKLLELRAHQFKGQGREITEKDGTETRIDVSMVVPMRLEKYWRENGMVPDTTAVEVHHQNNVRGLTRLEVVAYHAVISRPLPAPAVVEELAWVASGHVGESLPEGEWYPTREVGVLMRDGTGRKTKQVYHPHPLVEAIRWQICEGELLQDEARARAARRDAITPLVVEVITNVPLSLEIDEAVTYDDIVNEADPVSMSVARGMIAADWLGVGMVCRDLFPGANDLANAAKQWGKRNPERRAALDRLRGGACQTPIKDLLLYRSLTRGGARYRRYRYQLMDDATVREIAISDDHADPQKALQKVMGPLQRFELVEEGKTVAETQNIEEAKAESLLKPGAIPLGNEIPDVAQRKPSVIDPVRPAVLHVRANITASGIKIPDPSSAPWPNTDPEIAALRAVNWNGTDDPLSDLL